MELVGTLLDGRYFLRKLLGSGNFGAVYLAEQRVFGLGLRTVALKLFRRAMVTEANAAEVLNDAVVLMRLQQERTHESVAPYLVTVLDAGVLHDDPGQVFVAMEYADGYPTPQGGAIRTLQGLIRAYHPVPVELALRWMTQVVRPLAWMHGLDPPVLHCDVKPDNILPHGPSTLKLADFGLAQLAFGAIGSSSGVGAVTCQPPETLAGKLPTPAADVYGLGLLFYEILAGRNPFLDVGLDARADKDHQAYLRHQIEARRHGLEPLSDRIRPDLREHPHLVEVIQRCLCFDASERYDNAGLLQRQLDGDEVTVAPQRSADRGQAQPHTSPPAGADPAPLDGQSLADAQSLARSQVELLAAQDHAVPGPMRRPDWREALRTCARGLRAYPGDADLLDLAAVAYEAGGQRGPATALRQKAMAARKGAGQ